MKTKLGISTGVLAALVYFAALFGGFGIGLIVLAGYVLLFEADEWLKRMAVKAVVFTVTLTVLSYLVGIIPDVIDVINSLLDIFNVNGIYLEWLNDIISFILTVISFVRTVAFLLLGIKAISKSTVYIPVIDGMVNKFIG